MGSEKGGSVLSARDQTSPVVESVIACEGSVVIGAKLMDVIVGEGSGEVGFAVVIATGIYTATGELANLKDRPIGALKLSGLQFLRTVASRVCCLIG